MPVCSNYILACVLIPLVEIDGRKLVQLIFGVEFFASTANSFSQSV